MIIPLFISIIWSTCGWLGLGVPGEVRRERGSVPAGKRFSVAAEMSLDSDDIS